MKEDRETNLDYDVVGLDWSSVVLSIGEKKEREETQREKKRNFGHGMFM